MVWDCKKGTGVVVRVKWNAAEFTNQTTLLIVYVDWSFSYMIVLYFP